MKRKVIQIRDLDLIEKQLDEAHTGVLAFADDKELIHQFVISFLYSDKNIYLVFNNSDEVLDRIVLDRKISFLIYKNENTPIKDEVFKVLSVKCIGTIKKVEEQRIVEDIITLYTKKYNLQSPQGEMYSADEKVMMIDTEEIQAAEITGK